MLYIIFIDKRCSQHATLRWIFNSLEARSAIELRNKRTQTLTSPSPPVALNTEVQQAMGQLEEPQTEDMEQVLAQIVGVDVVVARRVLRKHKGDMQRAADAILEGDRGETNVWESQHRTTPDPSHSEGRSTAIAPHPSASVIDLTGGDQEEDLSRAIQMSLQDTEPNAGPQFTKTDRAPDPNWQMVRSNAPVEGASATAQDRILDDAIQASLQDFNKESTDTIPPTLTLRQGDRPVALRHNHAEYAYTSVVLHALFHVPQIRSILSTIRLPKIEENELADNTDRIVWRLIDLFTNLDLAQISYLWEIEVATPLGLPPWEPSVPLSSASTNVVRVVNGVVEQYMRAQSGAEEEPERLFSFRHGRVFIGAENLLERITPCAEEGGPVVVVGFGGDNPHTDLVSCMEYNLTNSNNNTVHYDVILEPSDILGFQLTRANPRGSTTKGSVDLISYPKTLYLDRFLFDRFALAHEKRTIEQKMRQDIQELTAQREALTRHNDRDALSDLRTVLHYYEHVAEKGDETRQRDLERTSSQIKDILTMITSKVEDIDHRLGKLQTEVNSLFDCPELRQHRYDLRAVLMHTGLPGRKQIYSYVQDAEGTWWKTTDTEVVGVPEETVLTDPTGVHLGAGPYLLFYSRHLSDEQLREPLVWPTIFSEAIDENNKKFLAHLHPELGILLDEIPPPDSQETSVEESQGTTATGIEGSNWSMSVD